MLRTCLPLICLAAPVAALQQVHVVGPGEPFATIQAAVAAAQDGDMVLVRPGFYPGFVIDGKSIVVSADSTGTLTSTSSNPFIEIRNLAPGQRAVVRGFTASGSLSFVPVVLVRSNGGIVWLEDLTLTHYTGGIRADQNADVFVVGCSVTRVPLVFGTLFSGGDGLEIVSTDAHVFDSHLEGGRGAFGGCLPGGSGGDGASVQQGSLYAAGSTFLGGDGGNTGSGWCSFAGPGGHGLNLLPIATASLLDNTFAGGADGFGGGFCSPGSGLGISGNGAVHLPGMAMAMTTTSPVREGANLRVDVVGPAGALAFLGVAEAPDALFLGPLSATLALHGPFGVLPLGTTDGSGAAGLALPMPSLGAGVSFAAFFGQCAYVDPAGPVLLGAPSAISLIDGAL